MIPCFWNTQQAVDWILSLDDGYFEKYEPALSENLFKWEIWGSELYEIKDREWLNAGISLRQDRDILESHIVWTIFWWCILPSIFGFVFVFLCFLHLCL